ncbi:MAG: OmpA family protein [Deltaproteobacteria bacterium]|nr:OmpA family protein [Deltaproteobacteria bacterium]
MKIRLGGIVAAALIVSATTAFGAIKGGQYSISPVIGGYTFDDRQNLETTPLYGARLGYNITKRFGIEGLFDYAKTEPENGGGDISMYRYGGELLYHMWPDNKLVPYLAAGFAGINFDGNGVNNKARGAFDYGLGAKYFLNDSFALRGDVRHIIYSHNNNTNNNIEYTLGAHIPFGGNAPAVKPVEKPVVPPPAPMPEPVKAVPPPPPAPTANLSVSPATIVKSKESATLGWTSRNSDKCAIQPGIGQVETQGSRSVSPAEDTAYMLTCSGPGGEATSNAKVGVTIPAPPAPAPVAQSAQKASAAQQRFCDKPAVLAVEFDTNKADIKPKYKADLEKLGTFLQEFPNAKGEISGHTDNVGGKEFNVKLSQRRADSVKSYIEKNFGIASDRLTGKGFGFSKPVASNKTKQGKAKNRRIETNFTCE